MRARTWGVFSALLIAIVLHDDAWCQTAGIDRIIGLVAPDGGAALVKHFHVPTGSAIVGVEFVNNDRTTVFPRVAVVAGPAKRLSEATVLAEVTNVRQLLHHRVQMAFPPIVLSTPDLYVVVTLPASNGVQGIGVGAGIGGTQLGAPAECYIAPTADERFQAIDVDLAINLVFRGVAKSAPSEGEASRETLGTAPEVRPNPFNPTTMIEFNVPETTRVELEIYDVAGRLVRSVVSGQVPAGVQRREWDGRDNQGRSAATGIYVAKLRVGDENFTKKLILTK